MTPMPAPHEPDETTWRQWREDGVVPLPGALPGAEVDALRAAFAAAAQAARPAWLQAVAEGTLPAAFFDIPDALDRDPLFLDLVDHPGWYEHLKAYTEGRVTFMGAQFRTVPPAPLSYVGWHYDVPHTTPLHLKVQVYLDDTGADDGAFAYVPGTHRPDSGPYPLVADLASMPGHRVYGGPAGTAVLFNSYGLHTSMVNRSARPRRSIILIYEIATPATFKPEVYARFADRCTTPERRQLFRLEPRPATGPAPGVVETTDRAPRRDAHPAPAGSAPADRPHERPWATPQDASTGIAARLRDIPADRDPAITPVIDAHVHVFARASAEFPREVSDHLPAEREAPVEALLGRMEEHRVDGAVLVQIGGTGIEQHAYLTHCLRAHADRFLGIGLVPPACREPGDHIERLVDASDGRLVGVRLGNLGGPADPFAPLDVRQLPVYPIWEHAARHDRVIWLYPRAADAHVVPHLFQAFPQVRVVCNHMMVCPGPKFWWDEKGRPQAEVPMPPQTRYSTMGLKIGRILNNTRGHYPYPNVCVHLSGHYAFSKQDYPYPDLDGWQHSLRMVFGARRLMWATDFPWIEAGPGYDRLLELPDLVYPDLGADERADIMGRTAAQFLRFPGLRDTEGWLTPP